LPSVIDTSPPFKIRSLSTFAVEKARLLSAGLYIAAAVDGADPNDPEKSIYVELIFRFQFFIIFFYV
jgi:hypothetical protein